MATKFNIPAKIAKKVYEIVIEERAAGERYSHIDGDLTAQFDGRRVNLYWNDFIKLTKGGSVTARATLSEHQQNYIRIACTQFVNDYTSS